MFGCSSPSTNNKSTAVSLPDSTHSYNRDTVFSVKSIKDDVGMLNLYFSPIKIINKKVALWKPTLDDFFNMPISDDGFCHTIIDTIIKLNNKSYIILMRTDAYNKSEKIIDAHVSSPTYSIATVNARDKQFYVDNFKKDLISVGSFGNGYDTLSIEKFGKDYPLLKFSSGYTGTGTVTNTNTYFELDNFKQVFEYDSYRSGGDSTEIDPNYSETKRYLTHIPNKGSQYRDDIELKCINKYFNKSKKKIESKQTTEYYREDDFGNFKRALE